MPSLFVYTLPPDSRPTFIDIGTLDKDREMR